MAWRLTQVACAVFALALFSANSFGDVVLTEDFTYADGGLDGNGGWNNHSGTPGTLLVSGNAATVSHDSGSGDVNRHFDGDIAYTSGILSATFDVMVTNAGGGGISGGDYEYFAHFYPSDDGFNFRSRTDIVDPTGAGDYSFGIATSSSAAEFTTTVDFAFDVFNTVTITFDLDNGISTLTAGGETLTTTDISLGQSINAFALRQSNSSSDELITIDNLVVEHFAAVPEPSSLALLGLVSLGFVTRRRR